MKGYVSAVFLATIVLVLPSLAQAQDPANQIRSLNQVLDTLYEQMLPLCSRLISVGRGIAGFATTWYIAARVWGHISRAEPVDVYPLFRPFVLGFAVLIFPSVIAMINAVMKPTVQATAAMVTDSNAAVEQLLQMKEEAIKKTAYWQMYVGEDGNGDRDKWYKYHYPDQSESLFKSIGNDFKFAMAKASYNFRNAVKQWMSEILKVLFEAAALCINTIRTFYLLILAILGPLVFAIAVFDGFQHTLTVWIARYLNVFLWLPVANIFGGVLGKIQENMLKEDLHQISNNGDTFFSTTDTAYLIFLIIGIIGYFTVPSVANYIIHAGGNNALLQKVSTVFSSSTSSSLRSAGSSASTMVKDVYGGGAAVMQSGMAAGTGASNYFQEKLSGHKDANQ